ncbi:MAG: dTDP-4-dehydrorhamnose reductase [Bilophila wadsworthia]|jgi:dTDP-4-dehydrorhamnose reductase|uniref:dTDP-4-dehydrorhamnose reductase n=1 Tax=Bilophila wadsworthia TaxID=35833 RepID=UPI00242BE675|nr:dTDP-4-dehydrorhamnose reductase [Bilophila wadsworthia]
MKILLTGGRGMLGRTLCNMWQDMEILSTDIPEMDITNIGAFDTLCKKEYPDVVIHCAAVTAVDNCEANQEIAWKVNTLGSLNVASVCNRHNIRLIALSTDYVFDGFKDRPYNEFDLPSGGVNIYGQSKWAGEQAIRTHCPNHVIARTSWLYGPGGPSFVHTILGLADAKGSKLKVVCDQVGNPTSTFAVARALREIIDRPAIVGTFHLSCEGEASWYDFACELFALMKKSSPILPCTSEEYKTPARRPVNSRLEKKMLRLLGLRPMPEWRTALAEFITTEFH